ncbi:type II toxin-antitoxin system RelE/ParE family toxin [Aquipseudomonas alcaligenes]
MAKIVLTELADSDLTKIYEFYEPRVGAASAEEIVASVISALEQLLLFPGSGRASRAPDMRDLIFRFIPFYAAYRVVGDEIQVVRILHQHAESSQHW